jgi:hypothetical protein
VGAGVVDTPPLRPIPPHDNVVAEKREWHGIGAVRDSSKSYRVPLLAPIIRGHGSICVQPKPVVLQTCIKNTFRQGVFIQMYVIR